MKSRGTDRPLIIGYGNPLRGDDGIGCVVAERLLAQGHMQGLEVIFAHQLTPDLAEPLSRATLAIFVDAASNVVPGKIIAHAVRPDVPRNGIFGHHLTPAELLSYARVVFERAPYAWLISVGGEQWDICEELSEPVRAAVPRVLHQIRLLLDSYRIAALRAPLEAHHA